MVLVDSVMFDFDGSLILFKVMDGLSGFGNAGLKFRNFFSKIFVFTFDGFKILNSFFSCVLQLEEFARGTTGFLLGGFKFNLGFFLLLFGFSKKFIEVSLFLIKTGGGSV